jgi:hypothetical protein
MSYWPSVQDRARDGARVKSQINNARERRGDARESFRRRRWHDQLAVFAIVDPPAANHR